MWEIRIEENNYVTGTRIPFRKEKQDKVLTGNIRTLNEAKKLLNDLYLAEEAKECPIFHCDGTIRKHWTNRNKQEYMVAVDYTSPDLMKGKLERVYVKFYKA